MNYAALYQAVIFISPAYIVNAALMLLWFIEGRYGLKDADPPLSARMFGDHRTVAGVVLIVYAAWPIGTYFGSLLVGAVYSCGFLLGHVGSSYLKRRLHYKPGGRMLLVDQLDFALGIQAAYIIAGYGVLPYLPEVLALTLVIHPAADYAAYRLRVKEVPW